MTNENYQETIKNLINKIVNEVKNNPSLIKEQLSDNKEIREKLINTLADLFNELSTKIEDRYTMTLSNSTSEERKEVENEIKKLNGQIQLRISGIKEFYNNLIIELENLSNSK